MAFPAAAAGMLDRGVVGTKSATDDAIFQLQNEVDKLKERLDFMAPLLSLMNFTQDFFQKIECEASVQLTRIRNAKLTKLNAQSGVEEQKMVETAKWLNVATDVLLNLSEKEMASGTSMITNATTTPRSGPIFTPGPLATEVPALNSDFNSSSRTLYSRVSCPQTPMPPTSFTTSYSSTSSRGPPKLETVPDVESTLECGGFSLGKGTWANAYRQATGARRKALTLLCKTGIVTERELADDLTVINESHVEECVQIASEMLLRWPPRHGQPPIDEAKIFFEERLAALYMPRAPSPFSHD